MFSPLWSKAVFGVIGVLASVASSAAPAWIHHAPPRPIPTPPDRTTALAAGDFDGDGIIDLVVAQRVAEGGSLSVLRGLAPGGEPFLSASARFHLPINVDFMAAGDFDADGRIDLLASHRGATSLWFAAGDGRGGLEPARRVPLAGKATGFATGEINRRDGLPDLVVAVESATDPALLVYESPRGAIHADPEVIPLPATANALALGEADGEPEIDLVAAAGDQLVLVHGRDRRLTLGPSSRPRATAAVDRIPIAGRVAALAFGDRLGLLTSDGTLRTVDLRGASPLTMTEIRTRATAPAGLTAAKISSRSGIDWLITHDGGVTAYSSTPDRPGALVASGVLPLPGPVLPLRLDDDALHDLVFAAPVDGGVGYLLSAPLAAFVVNDPGDATDALPGDGACDDGLGRCTLRAAIEEANALSGADSIGFDLGSGTPTITLGSALPAVTETLTINGATGGATRVELDGSSAGTGATGLVVSGSADAVTFESLVINRFDGYGVRLETANNVIRDCHIGPDASGGGTVAGNMAGGLLITGSTATGNTIGGTLVSQRNVISNNEEFGIRIDLEASGNTIVGNYVGTDASGGAALGRDFLECVGESTDTTVGGMASSPGVPPGNLLSKVRVWDSVDNLFQGNMIGLDASGTVNLVGYLVIGDPWYWESTLATVGGSTPSARNVVRSMGVYSSSDSQILGNYVGTDASGMTAVGGGVYLEGADHIQIGGNTVSPGTPPGNVISGGGGIDLDRDVVGTGSSAVIQGNLIGVAADGRSALPNSRGVRVSPQCGATIGGEDPGDGNLISGNTSHGIELIGTSGNVFGNWIGVNLDGDPLPNDGDGIHRADGPPYDGPVTIGGATPGKRNVISGNLGNGITTLPFVPDIIAGNLIGVAPDGSTPAGNGGYGILARGFDTIGGTEATVPGSCEGACNVIAYNGLDGLRNSSGSDPPTIRGNSIYENDALGIDLGVAGVTSNSAGNDAYPQNFPVISCGWVGDAAARIGGTLRTKANQTFAIEVFSSAVADPSGHGEGRWYAGSTTCATDGDGRCSWFVAGIGVGQFFTATATGSWGTSEFSGVFDSALGAQGDDADADGVGDPCDNCPAIPNPYQADSDGDEVGNACDNCPSTPNPDQTDPDQDGIGDLCDNCPLDVNPGQVDSDGDGPGDVCDSCPDDENVGQEDTDGDAAGDVCDCRPGDPTDRAPAAITGVVASRIGEATIALTWNADPSADVYSITRGSLASLAAGQYGSCVVDGLSSRLYEDASALAPDEGFAYLIQGQNHDCGMGSLGFTGAGAQRSNGDPSACAGEPLSDHHAWSETTIYGFVSGTFAETHASDDTYETISEQFLGVINPQSALEHRWMVDVPAGSTKTLHVEGFRDDSIDGDDFRFEYSTNGVDFTAVSMPSLPLMDDNIDRVGTLPAGATGTLIIRVVDTDRTPGNDALDSVTIDELFVRVLP